MYLTLAVALLLVLLNAALALGGGYKAPAPLPDDRADIARPAFRNIHYVQDSFNRQFTDPLVRFFDLSRHCRKLFGKPKESMNVDALGEVANSSWFTNRNAAARMSDQRIARGPDTVEGPDTSGPWTIFRAKAEGVTPGFQIIDPQGIRYVIKFDPAGCNELASGAEVVCTKLFYAAGYHVPENYVVEFDPRIVRMGEKVKYTDEHGEKRSMTAVDLEKLLARIERLPDGRLRALASKYIPGKPLGSFRFHSTRPDDPNDIVPHEHRRELRGLRVICAWLSHHDIKANNSFDSYVTQDGRSYVRHYLIDFGSALGSAAIGPKPTFMGHENFFDPNDIAGNTLSLGLHVHSFEKDTSLAFPSIGRYRHSDFHPQKYEFNIPIPAFVNLTALDGYWGAKIVSSFTDSQLAAVVARGRYSNPEAARYLLETLIRRRDKVCRHWFGKVNPLDYFTIVKTADGELELCFADLALDCGIESDENTRYRYDLRLDGKALVKKKALGGVSRLVLPRSVLAASAGWKEAGMEGKQLEIKLQTSRNNGESWSRWTKVYLAWYNNMQGWIILGIKRQS